jgi:hypothetical protein
MERSGVGGPEREFKSLIQPYTDSVVFDNGTTLPRAMVSPAEKRVVDDALDNLLERTGDEVAISSLVPYPMPEGQWGFISMRSGALMPDLDDPSEPFVINALPAVEAAREEELFGEAGFLSAATGGRTPNQQMLEVDLPRAAEVTGGEADMLTAVFKAGQRTPSSEKLEQEYSMMWSRSNAGVVGQETYEAAWRRAAREQGTERRDRLDPLGGTPDVDVPDPLRDPLGSAVYASLLMDRLLQKYGDADKTLAAYYLGDDVIDEAGDDWKQVVPDDVFQFIERVKGGL